MALTRYPPECAVCPDPTRLSLLRLFCSITRPMAEPIKALLVDDHAAVQRGLAAFLSVYPDLERFGKAESSRRP